MFRRLCNFSPRKMQLCNLCSQPVGHTFTTNKSLILNTSVETARVEMLIVKVIIVSVSVILTKQMETKFLFTRCSHLIDSVSDRSGALGLHLGKFCGLISALEH